MLVHPVTVQALAVPSSAKASENPLTHGKQSCYGALINLRLIAPSVPKAVRWNLGKSVIAEGQDVQVLLCSTSTTKPDIYTIVAEVTDQGGQTQTTSVTVQIDPDVPS